ncbi:MAG: DinB family protein [Anaerolineae bacterium]|nr:DinB family protein [Anaerolineae bacterium]
MNSTITMEGGQRTAINKDFIPNLTLLLDLENTLLDTNVDKFISAYFKALSEFMTPVVDPDIFLSSLANATKSMIENNDPSKTLKQVFDKDFYQNLRVESEKIQPRITQFYDEVFPTLANLTKPKPEAIALVDWALSQGYQLAIATNPLFPMTATHQRLKWAGLAPEDKSFKVISSYETFHFSKPNPAYFAEVLGRMGWPEGSVVVVGDDLEQDMRSGNILGLPGFWINDSQSNKIDDIDLAGQGSIASLRPWLERTEIATLEPTTYTSKGLIAYLISVPASISGLLNQFSDRDLTRRPIPDEWSLTEIICHLRDTEREINFPRLRMILELDIPFIPSRDNADWAETRKYNDQDISKALNEFTSERIQLVNILKTLKREWQLEARHAIFGPTNLQELVKFMVEHDKLHIRQIWTILNQVIN